MSRLSFVLGITMLMMAGTAVFMVTFDRQSGTTARAEEKENRFFHRPEADQRSPRRSLSTSGSGPDHALALDPAITAHLDGNRKTQVEALLTRTEREARQKLAELTRQYDLTAQQQKQVLPYLLAHHRLAHPAMTVNGELLPVIAPGTTFEDSLAPLLDPSQQDTLIEEALDDEAWWKEIVGQLESDLDAAIENGEMVPAPDHSPVAPQPTDQPASGDGEASGHGGGNLFDLLGQ